MTTAIMMNVVTATTVNGHQQYTAIHCTVQQQHFVLMRTVR